MRTLILETIDAIREDLWSYFGLWWGLSFLMLWLQFALLMIGFQIHAANHVGWVNSFSHRNDGGRVVNNLGLLIYGSAWSRDFDEAYAKMQELKRTYSRGPFLDAWLKWMLALCPFVAAILMRWFFEHDVELLPRKSRPLVLLLFALSVFAGWLVLK